MSEQTISSHGDSLFLLGKRVAGLNAQGLFLKDIMHQAYFSSVHGKWVVNTDTLEHDSISPERVSGQFRTLATSTDASLLFALLSGYAQKSYQTIDPFSKGFTDSILSQFYPDLPSKPSGSYGAQFDINKILADCQFRVNFDQKESVLAAVTSPGEAIQCSERDILLATLLLLFAEVDVKPWIEQGEKLYPASTTFKILGALLRKDYTKEARFTGMLPRLFGMKGAKDQLLELLTRQTKEAREIFKLIGTVLENPSPKGDLDYKTYLLQSVKSLFGILIKPVDIERLHFLEDFSEGLTGLAKVADAQSNSLESIYLAQTSQIILQWIAPNWQNAEERLSKAEQGEEQFMWRKANGSEPMDEYVFMNTCAYANSATITDLLYFKHSRQLFEEGKVSNHLWSVIYRALERQRWILRFMNTWLKSSVRTTQQEEHFRVIFTQNVKNFQSALAQHMKAANSTFQKQVPSSLAECWLTAEAQLKFLLLNELETVTALVELLNSKGLTNESLEIFQKLLHLSDMPDSTQVGNTSSQPIYPINAEQDIINFNELITRYHEGEENLLGPLRELLHRTQDDRMQQYCVLMIVLLATKAKEWELALQMSTYLHDTIPNAWDLPGIPVLYQANYFGQELLVVDRILDALKTLQEHFPFEQVIKNLIDLYLERYTAQ